MMTTSTVSVKLEVDKERFRKLVRHHLAYNRRVADFEKLIFDMLNRRCDAGEERDGLYFDVAEFLTGNHCNPKGRKNADGDYPAVSVNYDYCMNAVSKPLDKGPWKVGTAMKMTSQVIRAGEKVLVGGPSWASRAARYQGEGKLLYNKQDRFKGLPNCMIAVIITTAAQKVKAHLANKLKWHVEHEEWIVKKAEFEKNNPKYMALRPVMKDLDDWIRNKGKGRHRLVWFEQRPGLSAWRGKAAPGVVKFTLAQAKEIAGTHRSRRRGFEGKVFWDNNPEMAALDDKHKEYEKKYVRSRKTKRNPDGFKHRPTFTRPDPIRHPEWSSFPAPQSGSNGYKDLVLTSENGMGSVTLNLLDGPETFRFWPDSRLKRFRVVSFDREIKKGKDKGKKVTIDIFSRFNKKLGIWRNTQIKGARLKFENIKFEEERGKDGELKSIDIKSADCYLVFTSEVRSMQLRERAKKVKKDEKLPDLVRVMGIDLGIINPAFIVQLIWDPGHEDGPVRFYRSTNVRDLDGTFWKISRLLDKIDENRRLSGKHVKGRTDNKKIRKRIKDLQDDISKKIASEIIRRAVLWQTDVIVMEFLKGFNPSKEFSKRQNKMLTGWMRRKITKFVEDMGQDAGIRVLQKRPAGSSRTCWRCGTVGCRFGLPKDKRTKTKRQKVKFSGYDLIGRLFACPNLECSGRKEEGDEILPYTVDADFNAAANMARCIMLKDAFAAFEARRDRGEKAKKREQEADEKALLPLLEKKYGISKKRKKKVDKAKPVCYESASS